MFKRYVKLILICLLSLTFLQCTKLGSDIKVTNGIKANYDKWADPIERLYITLSKKDEKGNEQSTACTASVVSHNTVLTASHCVLGAKTIKVLIFNKEELKSNYISAIKFYKHSSYNLGNDGNANATSTYDVAIVIFPDNTFKDILPLEISSTNVPVGSSVMLIGYGCYTLKQTEQLPWQYTPWGQRYGGGTQDLVQCDNNKWLDKRYGFNTVANTDFCYHGMIQVNEKQVKVDSGIEDPTGKDVSAGPGDSGGPLLAKLSSNYAIVGVASYVNGLYTNGKQSCYASPLNASNIQFFNSVAKLGAYIPGINIGVGVIEIDGKLRVVDKMYDNIYNKNIQSPKTVLSLSGTAINSKTTLKSVWDRYSMEQKTKLIWN